MKQRMLSQDIAKGLGILIVVQLHALQLSAGLFYLLAALFGFVMPFFIFMSGYNYRAKGLSPVQTMKKRVLAVFRVYAAWTLGVSAVMGAYFLIHGDGTPSEVLKSFAGAVLSESGCKMIGWTLPLSMFQHVLAPYWYLQYLITASVIFCLTADYALKSLPRLFSAVILLSGVTLLFVTLGITLPWGLHCAPLLAAVMLTGARLGRNNLLFTASSSAGWTVLNSLASLVIVDLIQFFFPSAGLLGACLLGDSAGGLEVLFVFCFAVFGSFFLISFSRLLEKAPVVSKGLIWCGQHSLIILCLHRPVAYLIRDAMRLPHFQSGSPLNGEGISAENVTAFLLVFVIMVPVIMIVDSLKAKREIRA